MHALELLHTALECHRKVKVPKNKLPNFIVKTFDSDLLKFSMLHVEN